MRFRNSRLRTKVTALLVSLTALWSFAAWVTLREGVNLLWVATLDSGVSRPADPLIAELQRERRLSVVLVSNPGLQQRTALDVQRGRTDRARATFERRARGGDVKRAASPTLEGRITETLNALSALDAGRRSIDSGVVDRARAAGFYTGTIDSIWRTFDAMATLDDQAFARDTRTLIEGERAWDLLAQEDAMLAGPLAAGRFTAADRTQFIQIVGARRFLADRTAVELQHADRVAYEKWTKSETVARVRSLEDQVMQGSRPGMRPPVTAERWHAATEPALTEVRQTVRSAGDRLVDRATPIATWVIVRLVMAGGLGLLAVIASIVVSITTARALVQQLERLRGAAWELADKRLPSVVERLGRGEEVDVATEVPPLEFGSDEIGQVGQAFNAVQQTAIRVAVEQAELRRGIRDILLSLARRTQTLVRRQLSILDVMERRELDPTELEDLFRVDHLATRMRRNAENLIVLSGSTPARGWRRSVPMVDVLRAAVAEVEEYSRVNVLPVGQVTLAGRAVGDVTHLLAELIENAVSFSPSYTVVQVGGHLAASGYAIEIEDRGLGMSEESLENANAQIADSPEFNLSSTARLGLYVVSRLADRYGIRVSLKHSAYGGTTAIVLIPRDLVIEDEEVDGEAEMTPDAVSEAPRAVPVGATAGHGGGNAWPVGPAGRTTSGGPPAPPAASEPAARAGGPEKRTDPRPASLDHEGSAGDNGLPIRRSTAPGTTEARDDRPSPEATHTPSGLPFRVPQASLAPELRKDEPSSPAAESADDDVRSPEDIRRVMGAYQAGTRRGRSDAAQTVGEGGAPASEPEDDPQRHLPNKP